MLNKELTGKRKRGRPQRKFTDVMKKDMRTVGVTKEDDRGRVRWRQIICCGDH